MKQVKPWMLVVVGLAVVGLVAGQALPAVAVQKIGFVDIARVFDDYQRTKTSDKELEGKGKEKETELKGRVEELKKLRDGLELLSDKAKEERQKQVEEKSDELQRFQLAAQNELRRQRDSVAREILKEINDEVQAYAKAQGYDLVLNERTLVYGSQEMDVTDPILKQLNDHYASKKP